MVLNLLNQVNESLKKLFKHKEQTEQNKKGDRPMLPAFEVYQDRSGKWRWRLKARNGRIICDSAQGYINKEDAYAGINSVRRYVNSQIILLEDSESKQNS